MNCKKTSDGWTVTWRAMDLYDGERRDFERCFPAGQEQRARRFAAAAAALEPLTVDEMSDAVPSTAFDPDHPLASEQIFRLVGEYLEALFPGLYPTMTLEADPRTFALRPSGTLTWHCSSPDERPWLANAARRSCH